MAEEKALRTVDRNTEYPAVEPVSPDSLIAAIRDFKTLLFTPLGLGKTWLYLLTAQTVSAVRSWSCSGLVSVPAGGRLDYMPSVGGRILSFEIWNYDAAAALTLIINTTHGGTNPINIAANTYYTSDINMDPSTVFTLANATGGAVNAQIKVNGL